MVICTIIITIFILFATSLSFWNRGLSIVTSFSVAGLAIACFGMHLPKYWTSERAWFYRYFRPSWASAHPMVSESRWRKSLQVLADGRIYGKYKNCLYFDNYRSPRTLKRTPAWCPASHPSNEWGWYALMLCPSSPAARFWRSGRLLLQELVG